MTKTAKLKALEDAICTVDRCIINHLDIGMDNYLKILRVALHLETQYNQLKGKSCPKQHKTVLP